MKNIESLVSPLIKNQFPEFYQQEGPRFIDFVQQYYVWMESENQAINASRSLFDHRDIDKTSSEFINFYKQKYLQGYPLTSSSNSRLLTKQSIDIHRSKGTERNVQLTLRSIFGLPSRVYYPSSDIFKTSHGEWEVPIYLEVSTSPYTSTFPGKVLIGVDSGATAFCEALVKKRVNGKFISVLYLSDLNGNFQTGEYITAITSTTFADHPKVEGSLTSLTVVNGGANFQVGDLFDIQSDNGKQGKARVTSINNQTGTVTFVYESELESGGWGYSTAHSEVIVAQKMLTVGSKSNVNSSITDFLMFEDATQQFVNVAYSTAKPNNYYFDTGAIVENYYPNGSVSANGTIVVSSKQDANVGFLIIAPNVGNLVSSDTTFAIKGTGTQATFDARTGVANTSELITTVSPHSFVNNDIVVYSVRTGNTSLSALSVDTAYYVTNANTTTLKLTSSYGGVPIDLTSSGTSESGHVLTKSLGSGVITSYTDRTSSALVMGSNATFVGVVNVTSNAFISTPYAPLRGSLSNTTTYISNTSIGSGATFRISFLTNQETVSLNYYDLLSNNNTQTVPFYTINLNGNNTGVVYGSPVTLSTGDTAYGGFGFEKLGSSNMDSILLDTLRYASSNVGTIASLTGLNPGSGYNVKPFIKVIDTFTAGLNARDYVMNINLISGSFVYGEQLIQDSSIPVTTLTINGFTGISPSNGAVTSTVITGEQIYQSYANGDLRAQGFVATAGITGGSGTIALHNVTGTFVFTANSTTRMKSLSTGGLANISFIDLTSVATYASGYIKSGSNTSVLYVKRNQLVNDFKIGAPTLLGSTSGATATLISMHEDPLSIPIGTNANIAANVQTSNNVVTSLSVSDSGFGYIDNETVTLTAANSSYELVAITELNKQGVGTGFYRSTKGFLDSDKKIQDNDYYQDFSYEVITKIPFTQYIDILKRVTHVAGTKPFGRIESTSIANTQMSIINNITISS